MADSPGVDGGFEAPEGEDTPDPASMTVNQIKEWMTERGHEQQVFQLNKDKAKKPQWVGAMRAVM